MGLKRLYGGLPAVGFVLIQFAVPDSWSVEQTVLLVGGVVAIAWGFAGWEVAKLKAAADGARE